MSRIDVGNSNNSMSLPLNYAQGAKPVIGDNILQFAVNDLLTAKNAAEQGVALRDLDSISGGRKETQAFLNLFVSLEAGGRLTNGLHPKIADRVAALEAKGEDIAIARDYDKRTIELRYAFVDSAQINGYATQKYTRTETYDMDTGRQLSVAQDLKTSSKSVKQAHQVNLLDKNVAGPVDKQIPENGTGYEVYKNPPPSRGRDHQWVTEGALARLTLLGEKWSESQNVPIRVGHGSYKGGGDTPAHGSHENGWDIDFRPFRTDGANAGVTWQQQDYDRAKTIEFMRLIHKEYPNSIILYNDPASIKAGLSIPYDGHDNHVHVKFKNIK